MTDVDLSLEVREVAGPDGVRGFAIPAAVAWLEERLSEGPLHRWAASHPDVDGRTGRGTVWLVPAPVAGPDGRGRWAVRHYRRGGLVAPLLGDRYLATGIPRPWHERAAAALLRRRGVPTPAVVAGAIYPAGPFYRADLVTEMVPDSADLTTVLAGTGDGLSIPPAGALEVAGAAVASAARAGLLHRDLNAGNVVLTKGREGVEAWLVDLDRCQIDVASAPRREERMLRRLRRSLEKSERAGLLRLPPGAMDALTRGAEEER